LIEVDIPMVDTVTRSAHVDRKLDRMERLKFGLPLTRASLENAFLCNFQTWHGHLFFIFTKKGIFF